MSSPTEIRSQVINGEYATDKVVRIFTGTYGSSNLIPRVGTISTAYVHRIPHGLNRPMMCEVMTSTDGGVTFDGGVNKIAFSDSTYIYIFDGYSAVISTVTYKVYCRWIDDFDATNPSIESIMYSNNPKAFDSRDNYQKVYRSNVINVPAGTFGSLLTTTIAHDLGYKPNVKAYFEAFSGEVWPLNIGGSRNFYLYDFAQDECGTDIYSDRIEINCFRFSNAIRRVWYTIYYDAEEV